MKGAYHIEQELFYSDDIRQDAGIGAAQDGWLQPTDSSLFLPVSCSQTTQTMNLQKETADQLT